MTIGRVNDTGWQKGGDFTSPQMNALDINLTYCCDTRDGYSQTLSSNVTVNGSLTFPTGSTLTIDPSTVSIGTGVLSIGAELNGDASQNSPLRFGYVNDTATTPNLTLDATSYSKMCHNLTGVLTADTTITFPTVAGAIWIVSNHTTGNFSLLLQTASQLIPSQLVQGKSVIIYGDGTSIIPITTPPSNSIVSLQSKNEVTAYGTTFQTTTTTGVDVVGYSFNFPSATTGDKFKIMLRGTLTTDTNAQVAKLYCARVIAGTPLQLNSATLQTTITTATAGTIATIFTATTTASHTFKLVLGASGSGAMATLATPLFFSVEQIKI